MVNLEEILKRVVKEKYLGLKGKNFRTKLQKAINLYVNDLAKFPDGNNGQLTFLDVKARGNEGEVIVSYIPLVKEYDEKKLKQVPQDFFFNNINFSIIYARTTSPEIVKVDYNKYKGRSSAAGRADD